MERATFSRRHVVEEIAAAHRQGATVRDVGRLADRFLAREHVVELGEVSKALDQARDEGGTGLLTYRWQQASSIVTDIRSALYQSGGNG